MMEFLKKLFGLGVSTEEKLFSSLERYCREDRYRKKFTSEIELWANEKKVPPFYLILQAFSDWSTLRAPFEGKSLIAEVVWFCKTPEVGEQLIRLFHQKGVSVDQRDDNGNSALHDTNYFKAEFDPFCLSYTALLLNLGADINATNHRGCTPLHLAASASAGQVEFLLEHGADPLIRDSDGLLPLDCTKWSSFDSAKNRNLLKKAMGIAEKTVSAPPIAYEVRIVPKEEFEKIPYSQPVEFNEQFTQKMLADEFEELSAALEGELSRQPGNYRITAEFQGNFFHCGGIYSNNAATPEYVSAILRAISRMPHAEDWYFHTACELELEEDSPVLSPAGEFLIHNHMVYAPDDGNDYISLLSVRGK